MASILFSSDDHNAIVSGSAFVSSSDIKYRQNKITRIELLRIDPYNSKEYSAIVGAWRCPGENYDNRHEVKITERSFPVNGWWKIVYRYTLLDGSFDYSHPESIYVRRGITDLLGDVVVASLTLGGKTLLLSGQPLLLK